MNLFSVKHVAITEPSAYLSNIDSLKSEFRGVRFYQGESGTIEMLNAAGADTVLTAVVGASGIRATMAAFALGMKVALANKETMVTAGPAIVESIRRAAIKPVIIPVDSEHSAVFQLIREMNRNHLRRIILTASGGPFRDYTIDQIKRVSREQVLSHPTWSMGPKISVDSAGMINKGLEVIEAHYLFSVPYEMLDVYIHRESYVHGMIETREGGYLFAASNPHMVFPIANALYFPEMICEPHPQSSGPHTWPPLVFETIDHEKYPGFRICVEAGKRGGTAPAIMNAANEIAVEYFLKGIIEFTDIPVIIEMVLGEIDTEYGLELELYLEADGRARELARKRAASRRIG